MTIAHFTGKTDNVAKAKSVEWPKLASTLTTHRVTKTKDISLWCPGSMADGARRAIESVAVVSCFVLDVDSGLAPDDFVEHWAAQGLEFVVHSSYSSTSEHPKWRAVFPLEEPVPCAEWPATWEKLNLHLGLGLGDPACKDASRMYFYPSCPDITAAFTFSNSGRMIHADEYQDIQAAEPETKVRPAMNGQLRAGDDFDARGDWEPMIQGTLGMHHPRRYGPLTVWTRAGKRTGVSARTGEGTAGDRFYCWSSSVPGVAPCTLYSKFGLYAALYHRGDFSAAAKDLASKGYGSPAKAKATVKDWNRMEGEKTVREMRTEDLAAKFAHVKSIDAYEEEMPEFLPGWEPYIRTGQMTDLVAKGESGKTTFLTAIAAGGSIGRGFAGEACEPFKTVYFACEDDPGEIRGVYRECGGLDGDWLIPWKDLLTLNDSGLDELDDILTYFKPRLIAFDSTKYYMPEGIKAMFDNVGIARLCNNIRPVLQKHRCGCVSVRHTKQSVKGIPMTDWGEGGDQWRNSARSQMVMVRHPKTPRQAGIWHTKASLRAGRGEPFQVGFSAGELCYTKGAYFEDYGLEEKQVPSFGVIPRGERGPAPAKLQAAMDALILLLSSGPKPYHSVLDLASKAAECSRSLLFEAKKQLGLVYSEADKTLALPADFDMFEDPREGGGGNPWWSEK